MKTAIVTVLFLLAPALAPAQEPALAPDETRALQERVSALEKAARSPSLRNSKRMELSGYIQPRFDFVERGVDSKGKEAPSKSGFTLRRARLQLEGEVHPKVGYKIQMSLGDKGTVKLLDAQLEFQHLGPAAVLAAGQVNPEDLGDGTSKNQQFADKENNVGATLDPGSRDRGILLEGSFLNERLSYAAQYVNGNGITDSDSGSNDNPQLRYGLLLMLQPLGAASKKPYDLDHSPWRFGLGFSATGSRDRDSANSAEHQDKGWFHAAARASGKGFFGKLLFARQDADYNPGSAKDEEYWSAQAGRVLPAWLGHKLEPAVRYQVLNKDKSKADRTERWTTLGLNYYLNKDLSKLQLNYILRREQGANRIDNDTLQLQYTLLF